MADNLRLVLMTFPQRWNAATATLDVNVMLIPSISPVDDPLLGGASPKFADHVPTLDAVIIGSLDATPTRLDPTAIRITPTIIDPSALVPTRSNYNKLVAQAQNKGITLTGSGALTSPSQSTIRKALPRSYLDATGATPGGNTATVDEFGCAIQGQPVYPPAPLPTTVGWGPMISYALRQPVLATLLGLRYAMQVNLEGQDPALLNAGGWLFIEIASTDTWAAGQTPGGPIRLYAARLPALTATATRQIFGAVVFPVDATKPIDDSAFSVAETYDDGFAQIVHLNQPQANNSAFGSDSGIPAASDSGIQIGWDDEQVVAWQNGQVQILNDRINGSSNFDARTPLGVLGYRVDVADVTSHGASVDWHSLVVADVTLPQDFGSFNGELAIEPTPSRPQAPGNSPPGSGEAWLPHYFANWRGGSLAVADPVTPAMLAGTPITATPDPIGVLLAYGHSYAFRVRLADLSSGSARVTDMPVNAGPYSAATIDFLRSVPPKKPGIRVNLPAGQTSTYGTWPPPQYVIPEPESLTFTRPLIGYPEVLYTGLGDTDAHRGQIVEYFTQNAHPGSGLVVGLPDPDVETLEIVVEVRTPLHDVAGDGILDSPFRQLYSTTRTFPTLPAGPLPTDPGLRIDIAYVDAPSIIDWAADGWPTSGALVLPRARDVRITARAITRNDPAYFSPVATTGLVATIIVRAELRNEPSLLIAPVDGSAPLRGFLFQRPPGIDAPTVAAQLGQALNLAVDGLTFSAPAGERIVFGASKSVRHTLSGDNSAITIAAQSELLRRWVVALVADLDRDWTWDGLAKNNAISVERNGDPAGSLTIVRTIGGAAVADPANWDRRRTRLVFFDSIDPHEVTASGFPQALPHTWQLSASTTEETTAPVGVSGSPTLNPGTITQPEPPDLNGANQSLTLPIAIPPSQIPEIASVGLALTPFSAGVGYASTTPRSRALWIELKAPLDNPTGDALFARILAHGADPLLYAATPGTDQPEEPPLVLDPELMRVITPGESDDRSGLDAMTMLVPASDSNIHYTLPLPPGIDADDPELFGFYTYEFRVGHAGDPHDHRWWSTAQGRYGRPLRVSGVQHPAPLLVCRAGRFSLNLFTLSSVGGTAEAQMATALSTSTQFSHLADRISPNLSASMRASLDSLRSRAPALSPGEVSRLSSYVIATATYATPVLNGRPLVGPGDEPLTTLFFFLYAQVVQADAASNRNILLFQRPGTFFGPRVGARYSRYTPPSQRDRVGGTFFSEAEIEEALVRLGLPVNLPLSVLAVELLPGGVGVDLPDRNNPRRANSAAYETTVVDQNPDPLGLNGKPRRILRVSPLVPVAAIC